MTEKQLSEIMYEVCDSLNVPLTHEESELIMHHSKAIKRKLESGQHETIVKRMEFENWVREVVEIDNRLSFLIDGYQTGEIFEWHKWWLEGLTAIEAVNRNHSEYA